MESNLVTLIRQHKALQGMHIAQGPLDMRYSVLAEPVIAWAYGPDSLVFAEETQCGIKFFELCAMDSDAEWTTSVKDAAENVSMGYVLPEKVLAFKLIDHQRFYAVQGTAAAGMQEEDKALLEGWLSKCDAAELELIAGDTIMERLELDNECLDSNYNNRYGTTYSEKNEINKSLTMRNGIFNFCMTPGLPKVYSVYRPDRYSMPIRQLMFEIDADRRPSERLYSMLCRFDNFHSYDFMYFEPAIIAPYPSEACRSSYYDKKPFTGLIAHNILPLSNDNLKAKLLKLVWDTTIKNRRLLLASQVSSHQFDIVARYKNGNLHFSKFTIDTGSKLAGSVTNLDSRDLGYLRDRDKRAHHKAFYTNSTEIQEVLNLLDTYTMVTNLKT